MAKIVDKNGNEIENPDLEKGYLTPYATFHHDAVTHDDSITLPNGCIITYTVVDTPAYDEVTVYLYTEYEPTDEERLQALESIVDDVLVALVEV